MGSRRTIKGVGEQLKQLVNNNSSPTPVGEELSEWANNYLMILSLSTSSGPSRSDLKQSLPLKEHRVRVLLIVKEGHEAAQVGPVCRHERTADPRHCRLIQNKTIRCEECFL